MTNNELLLKLSQDTGLNKVECQKFLHSLTKTIAKAMVEEETVAINGFAKFSPSKRPGRRVMSFNGEEISVPSSMNMNCRLNHRFVQEINPNKEIDTYLESYKEIQ